MLRDDRQTSHLVDHDFPLYPFSISVEKLVHKWAPLVFLAPGERFFPGSVTEFLEHVLPLPFGDIGNQVYDNDLPKGFASQTWNLVTKESVGKIIF